jgi:hypothetical protein
MAESRGLVVFSILRESTCSECNKELRRGDFLCKEGERGLCMSCADLDELVYLPRGDAALTRRARKYSPLSAIVVRFSRARKRYKRQGILVSEAAFDQAEEECLADSELRALRRGVGNAMRSAVPIMINASSRKWRRKLRRCSPVVEPKKREPSQNTPRAGAAAGWDALPAANRSSSKP